MGPDCVPERPKSAEFVPLRDDPGDASRLFASQPRLSETVGHLDTVEVADSSSAKPTTFPFSPFLYGLLAGVFGRCMRGSPLGPMGRVGGVDGDARRSWTTWLTRVTGTWSSRARPLIEMPRCGLGRRFLALHGGRHYNSRGLCGLTGRLGSGRAALGSFCEAAGWAGTARRWRGTSGESAGAATGETAGAADGATTQAALRGRLGASWRWARGVAGWAAWALWVWSWRSSARARSWERSRSRR
jgi:hypothetical protein